MVKAARQSPKRALQRFLDERKSPARSQGSPDSGAILPRSKRKWRKPAKLMAEGPPDLIAPCLATLVEAPPEGPGWLHEIKWDGYRLMARLDRARVRLDTRHGHDWTARFPTIAAALTALEARTAILDGEAIVENDAGISDFAALQAALADGPAAAAVFCAFDLLYLDGVDLRDRALQERKALLERLLAPLGPGAGIRYSDHVRSDGAAMVRHAGLMGFEGVVSKRADRPYRSGRREEWLKTKCTDREEFVVAGYVPSAATRKAVGSLVLGYYRASRLVHAGRVGTGFSGTLARSLRRWLDADRRDEAPFAERLGAPERRGVVWFEPQLVAEVEHRGWGKDNLLRHAAFKGLREDKRPEEVTR
jgi:bifunctional non-homologous end joining protein LigD